MTEKEKAIKAIKEVRLIEGNHHNKSIFCREHNMMLDAMKHEQIERELGKAIRIFQNAFETGYVE